jgi:hypothetical protein
MEGPLRQRMSAGLRLQPPRIADQWANPFRGLARQAPMLWCPHRFPPPIPRVATRGPAR